MKACHLLFILAIAAFAAGALVGCSINGGGPWISRTERTVNHGNSFSVSVTADSGLQKHINDFADRAVG
ncbi:hypothetical protein [Demequina lutea]|uniref:Uncharacterized protein n=1 Tax=Demequina lutea TaxID=431489 RepID=A0A7Z0CKS0_9MICO|nr:hypothetical protein [Demequina lutea]NYI42208.1 hypothetical protein [Demequina lutea]